MSGLDLCAVIPLHFARTKAGRILGEWNVHTEPPYARLLKNSVLSIDDAGYGDLEPATELMRQINEDRTGKTHLVARDDGRLVRVAG